MTFEELELDPVLLAAIEEQHFNKPTPVQAEVIPEFVLRRDILAGAATGTGKTAAFVLPILQVLLDEPRPTNQPRALILAPTRELAFQIHKVVKQLGDHCNFRSNIVTGGFASDKQLENLNGPLDILVATPGRLLNILSKEFIDLSFIDMVIIDEADRMLDMGQGPDVLVLLEAIPTDFQAACFSATLGGSGVARFAEDILDDPAIIQIDAPNQQSQQVQQVLYFADSREHKRALLTNLLEDGSCKSALVFCNRKERAIELEAWLQEQKVSVDLLHGDMIQAKRMEITRKFTQGKTKVLVATDVAARGLDMLNITHVINYDLPHRGDTYIHRIGRTGRGQNVGIAISLVEIHDLKPLERIQYHMQAKIPVSKIAGLEPQHNTGKAKKAAKKPHKKKIAKKLAKTKKTSKKK